MTSHDLEIIKETDLVEQKANLKEPDMYNVILLNDDYTPMDFVVELLLKFFNLGLEQATKVMMQIHTEGQGVCGIYTRQIAETRQTQVNEYAKHHKHILKAIIKKQES